MNQHEQENADAVKALHEDGLVNSGWEPLPAAIEQVKAVVKAMRVHIAELKSTIRRMTR